MCLTPARELRPRASYVGAATYPYAMRLKVAELKNRFPSPWELYSLVVLAGAAVYIPLSYLMPAMPPLESPLRFSGAACPLCGGTRAVTAFFIGEFGLALRYNPLALVVLALFVWAVASWLFLVVPFRRRIVVEASKGQHIAFWVLVVLAFLANWAYVLWAGMYRVPLEI